MFITLVGDSPMISITDNRISGAEEPKAMRLRFATVGFQTLIGIVAPSLSLTFGLTAIEGRVSVNGHNDGNRIGNG